MIAAANIAQVLVIEYGGDCRNCGATPLRLIEDITESLELPALPAERTGT